MHFVRSIIGYLFQYKMLCFLFSLGLVIEVAYSVAAPLSLKYMIDEAFTPKDAKMFFTILVLLFVGGTVSLLAGISGDYALSKLSGKIIRKLRTTLFAHLQKQSPYFFQHYQIGDLVTRFSADMLAIEKVFNHAAPFGLREMLSIILGIVLLLLLEWKLTVAMLVGSLLMFIGPKLFQGRAETSNLNYKEAQEQFINTIDESVKGYKTIKSLHQQEFYYQRAKQQIHNMFSLGLKMNVMNSLLERFPLMSLLLLNGTMLGLGGYLIFQGKMTVGDFIAFFTLFMTVGQSLANLSFVIPNIIDSKISFQRLAEILNFKVLVLEAKSPVEFPTEAREIKMDNVTFGYSEETDQLKGISLSIDANSFVAFVGSSGSGKSTVLQLLMRFYDPKEGTVSLDNYDLRMISEASLRKQMGMVSQDTFLFNTTIRENLLLDNGEISDIEMIEAAKLAKIHETIISWPKGYDTVIYNHGASLSGGQRQRLAFARALLRNPSTLLLDEFTSALDPVTEAEMNQSLKRIRKEKTIISVTHRLSSVVDADVIFVFNDGEIVESGTHTELLEKGGFYRNMWEKQQGFQLSQDGLEARIDIGRLAKFPFFRGIELTLLEGIATLFSTETCKMGEIVINEGDKGDKFYIIVRGKFEVMKRLKDGKEKRLAILQDGDYFGEIALLQDILRTATVRSLEPSVLLTLRREAFLDLTVTYPQILETVERTLLERM